MSPRVVALWATPRSVSTAFEKTFSRRADARVVHEPFTDCYYFSAGRRSRRYGDQPDKLGYDGAAAEACVAGDRTSPLTFVKELCFQAEPFVARGFLAGASNTFILRSPAETWTSLLPLKPDFTEEEFGYLAMERMWRRVVGELGQPPVVVDGTVFRAEPECVLRMYCESLELSFDENMLHWPDGQIRRWSADERESQQKWHHTLEDSRGILPPAPVGAPAVDPGRRDAYRRACEIYEEIASYAVTGAVIPR